MAISREAEKVTIPGTGVKMDTVRYSALSRKRESISFLIQKAHKVVAKYDKRADVENLVGEAKGEGLDAIPSAKFKNSYAYFQIVILWDIISGDILRCWHS